MEQHGIGTAKNTKLIQYTKKNKQQKQSKKWKFNMTCFHPITVYQKNCRTLTDNELITKQENKVHFHQKIKDGIKFEIPCGKCLGCRLDHASIWATRLANEAECWKKNCFITLTYRPKDLPIIEAGSHKGESTLRKRDVQLFLKRLRRHEKGFEPYYETKINENLEPETKETYPIRYFYCGEYGTNPNATHRAHYHMAIFNWQPDDLKFYKHKKTGNLEYDLFTSKKLQDYWGKGFVIIGILNYNTASYIARYVQKKAGLQPKKTKWDHHEDGTKEKIKTLADELAPELEFINMSTRIGIGKIYWQNNKDKIKRNNGIFIKIEDKVKHKPIPRYYKKLWERENYAEFYRWKYERQKDFEIKKLEIISRESYKWGYIDYKWDMYLKKEEELLKSKAKYLRRNNFT